MKLNSNQPKLPPTVLAAQIWQFIRYFLLITLILTTNIIFPTRSLAIENPQPIPKVEKEKQAETPPPASISARPSPIKPKPKSQTTIPNQPVLINGIATDFINSSVITISDQVAPASPYPSTITVSGYTGTVVAVSVSLNNVAHRYMDDIDILLVGPTGQTTLIMSDVAFNVDTSENPVNLTFADNASSTIPTDTISSGIYKPTNYDDGFCPLDSFPAPAPNPPYNSALDGFNGLNPDGVWSLYVFDDCGGGAGAINNGWTLTLYQAGNITALSGSNQTALVQTTFSAPLVARVTDAGNNPLSGQPVIFEAPTSGPSGTFANGSTVYTATTDATGTVTTTAFTANNLGGSYNLAARAGFLANSTNFLLTNKGVAGGANVITGTKQATATNTSFRTALVAQLSDTAGNPLGETGVITFTAPLLGASGTFANGSTVYTATTNAAGIVTAPVFTANSFAGSYIVTASAGIGVVQAKFVLTNQTDTTADRVYGQEGSFTTNTRNKGGISATSLSNPAGLVLDNSGGLYLADLSNSRVLYYPNGNTAANRVYGQNGSFITNTANLGGISANSLAYPVAPVLASNGGLYITDNGNNRVLYYPPDSTTATRVYGQNGSFITNTANLGGISANSLAGPDYLALDSNGGLYVSDSTNNRVLYYPAGSTTATRVYGQDGNFATNNCEVGVTHLCAPEGLVLDKTGGLYIADSGNNRVVYFPAGSTTATRVYGQNDFDTYTPNNGGIGPHSLNVPIALVLDSSGGLYVGEFLNYRLLYFASDGDTIADRVYGQLGSFTSATRNNGGVSADSLWQEAGLLQDSSGGLYVADISNHRLLYYNNQAVGSFQLEKASHAQYEGNTIGLTVTRTGGSTLGAVITVSPTNLTASANDYSVSPGLLNWADGDSSPKTVTITLNSDGITEPVESLELTLASYNGGINLGSITTATLSILDSNCSNYLLITSTGDDGSCGTLRAAVSAASANPVANREVIITLAAGSVINLTSGLTLAQGVSIKTGVSCVTGPTIILVGSGDSSDVGLRLTGANSISGLWIKGFSSRQLSASGGGNKLLCVKTSKT